MHRCVGSRGATQMGGIGVMRLIECRSLSDVT